MRIPTDEELKEAARRGAEANRTEPRVTRAEYKDGKITLELAGGCLPGTVVTFPAEALPGLADASDELRAAMTVIPSGSAILWRGLDYDGTTPGLLYRALRLRSPADVARAGGAAGGSARTEAKVAAARANGAKGGRPRKPRPE